MKLKDNHISLTTAEQIKQAAALICTNTPISHFGYSRLYPNGNVLILVDDAYIHKHFWQNNFDDIFFDPSHYKDGINLREPRSSPDLRDAEDFFGHKYNTIISNSMPNYIESIHVSSDSTKCTNYINFLFNNLDTLLNFKFCFLEKAKDLIALAEKDPIQTNVISDDPPVEEYNERILPAKYHFMIDEKIIYITCREMELLQHILMHRSAKRIGRLLNISSRTVESRIQVLKEKMNVTDAKCLVEKLMQNFNFREIAVGRINRTK